MTTTTVPAAAVEAGERTAEEILTAKMTELARDVRERVAGCGPTFPCPALTGWNKLYNAREYVRRMEGK